MKVKLSSDDREYVVWRTLENRAYYKNEDCDVMPIETCPFNLECRICEMIFPSFKKYRLSRPCPCGTFKTSYVKRRMRLLFPELY